MAAIDVFDVLAGRRAGPPEHPFELVDGGSARKHGFAQKHLADETPQRPYVNFLAVIFAAQQQFGRPIPPRGDIIGHNNQLLVGGLLLEPHESEVAKFGLAVLINEDVGRLEVPVDEVGVVEVEDGFGNLVDDELLVPFLQLGRLAVLPDQLVQVDVHVLEHQVDVFVVAGWDHALQADDVRVLQLPQEHDFAVGALRVGGVGEGVEVFFECLGDLAATLLHLPNMPVGTASDLLAGLVQLQHMCLNLLTHQTDYYYVIITD